MRTGIRSGIAPSDVWHLKRVGRDVPATVCGRVRARAAVRIGGDRALEDVARQIESQGGTVCRACAAIWSGGRGPLDIHVGDRVETTCCVPACMSGEVVRITADGIHIRQGDGTVYGSAKRYLRVVERRIGKASRT